MQVVEPVEPPLGNHVSTVKGEEQGSFGTELPSLSVAAGIPGAWSSTKLISEASSAARFGVVGTSL